MIPLVACLVYLTDLHARWEVEVAAMVRRTPAQPGSIVFAGSSSIRLWKLEQSFPGRADIINAGFGGSQVREVTHFASRLILPHTPRQIVLYAGDNDIASGRMPEQVLADSRSFCQTIHARLPACRIIILSIKPSIARVKQLPQQQWANQLVQVFCATDARLSFLDLDASLRDANSQLVADYFVKDGLHLSPRGYARWTERLSPLLLPRP
jgi:lysophospholipase L1-like esterase